MSRELKFKAWDGTHWFEWKVVESGYFEGMWTFQSDARPTNYSWEHKFIKKVQYTGLKDKNGSDIYDRDIVQTNFLLKGEVRWNRMASQWWIYLNHDRNRYKELVPDYGDEEHYCQYLEVIGNFHENPELLAP